MGSAASDGQTRRFAARDALLVKDTSGKGHRDLPVRGRSIVRLIIDMKKSSSLLIVLIVVLAAAACRRQSAQTNQANASGPAAAVETKTYHGTGEVTELKPELPSITIDHEDIGDFMPAMEMEFWVKDKALLDGLHDGDKIEFTLENGVGGIKITEIKKR